MPLSVACSNEEMVAGCKATPVTSSGRPAKIDGALTITVQSGDGTFAQDPTKPLDFDVISGDLAADTVYLVSADADLGAGTETIEDTVTLTVTSASAKSFGLSAGTTKPKAPAPAP